LEVDHGHSLIDSACQNPAGCGHNEIDSMSGFGKTIRDVDRNVLSATAIKRGKKERDVERRIIDGHLAPF
jgi:hypothetical protein